MHSSFVRTPALLAALALAAVSLAPLAARAQSYAAANAGTGVARISYVQGAVALQRGDSDTSTAAVINAPVLGADYVTTGAGSRAEIQLDDVTAIRLGANVQLRFTRLDANVRDVQLAEGTIDLRVLRANAAPAQVDTPSVAVRPASEGSFRVSVDPDGRTRVAVRSGRAEVVTPQGTRSVVPGVTLLAYGPAAQPALQMEAQLATDDFDRFNADRDTGELRALSEAYAPPGIAGVNDLAAYGNWVDDSTYGQVWVPTVVSPGWAPYRDGRWAWEDRYGWTWIGSEPWGWAPYHYGRWFHHPHRGWAWVPARAVVPWSPALVSFVTFGGGPGFGFDTIGWLPLAPFEPFFPWWGTSGAFVTFTQTTFVSYAPNRRNWCANARYGAVTAVDKHQFLAGNFDRLVRVPPDHLRKLEIVRGPVPVVPNESSLRFTAHPAGPELAVRPATFHRTFAGDAIVTPRVPFVQQRAAFAGAGYAVPAAQAAAQPAPRRALAPPAVDPWARFGTSRTTTVSHGVTVIDGSAPQGKTVEPPVRRGAHATDAWSRFERSSPASSRAETTRGSVTVRDLSVPRDAAPRTTESTHRAYETPRTQYTAPAPPPHPQYVPPPQSRYVAPPQYAPQQYAPPQQSAPRTTQPAPAPAQQSGHSASSQSRHAESSSGHHH